MSNPFVVCRSAEDAADLCFAIKQREASAMKTYHNDGKKSTKHSRLQPENRREKATKKPYDRQRKYGPSKSPNIDAPILTDMMLVGDSIALRLARQQHVWAPKYMALCYGGATWQSLQESLKKCTKEILKNIFVIAGTNNILKNMPVDSQLLQDTLNELKKKGAEKIYIATLPPMCTDENIQEIDEINSLLLNLDCKQNNIFVVNIFPLFLNEDKSIKKELFTKFYHNNQPDLVHPNSEGLQIIADKIFDVINSQMELT